jgi:hypothetical protein
MNLNELNALRNWFEVYTESFACSDEEDRRNILLKIDHTYHVCGNIVQIAEGESLSPNEIVLAEAVALVHDVGRFPQYARYGTFRDSISVNHGRLGVETLQREGVLRNLALTDQEIIMDSVRFHNSFSMSQLKREEKQPFLQLIRDADKLDIWRVFSEYFESDRGERASAAGLGLPDLPEYSDEVLSCIFRREVAPISKAKTLNDYKLVQLSWIFDVNFKTSLRLLLERDLIDRFISLLPETDRMKSLSPFLHDFIRQNSE